jgi:hypothetical protein
LKSGKSCTGKEKYMAASLAEVLQQAEHIRDFLLFSSIVKIPLHMPLCKAFHDSIGASLFLREDHIYILYSYRRKLHDRFPVDGRRLCSSQHDGL